MSRVNGKNIITGLAFIITYIKAEAAMDVQDNRQYIHLVFTWAIKVSEIGFSDKTMMTGAEESSTSSRIWGGRSIPVLRITREVPVWTGEWDITY